uniref:PALP domain-containing protein n=1 Tax=Bursaphelenchus xylophilus TaxID=6326 RepID=A0A1I7S7W5_BURXY
MNGRGRLCVYTGFTHSADGRILCRLMRRKSMGLVGVLVASMALHISRSAVGADQMSKVPMDSNRVDDSAWVRQSIQKLWEERKRMGYTPLVQMRIPGSPEMDFYFKDESRSRTGNLKHRFAWCLFMWSLVEGNVNRNTTIYEASSGNTATCEAYFSQLIGVPFVAVIPETTDQQKIDNIKKYGGEVHKTKSSQMFKDAAELAEKNHGFYMNQFQNAHHAEEFHESANNGLESVNVFHEVIQQLKTVDRSARPVYPDYFIHSAGTGGTISSVGRYVRKYGAKTKVIMSDTEFSVYYDYVIFDKFSNESGACYWVAPGMAGTGFGYSGPAILGKTTSLLPSVIDRAFKVPDLASTAAMHVLKKLGVNGGTSTGLNFVTALSMASRHRKRNPNSKFRVVAILADSSALYENTYFNKTWIGQVFKPHGGLPMFKCWQTIIEKSYRIGIDPLVAGPKRCRTENFQPGKLLYV